MHKKLRNIIVNTSIIIYGAQTGADNFVLHKGDWKKMTELKEEAFDSDMVKSSPKLEESNFSTNYEKLKSAVKVLSITVKQDEEKMANIKSELSKINLQDPEKALMQKKHNKAVITAISILGVICFIVGAILIGIGELGTLIPGLFCEIFALSLFIATLVIWNSDKKIDVDSAKRALERRNKLSEALTVASNTAEEHRNELQKKQAELDRYILGL